MNGKQKFMSALNRSKLSCNHRCMLSCGCQRRVKELEHKLIGGLYPEVTDAPDPTLILWSNLGVGRVNRCCRASLNYLFSVLIIAIGFVIIIYIGNLRDKRVDSAWQPTSCGSEYYLAEAEVDYFAAAEEQKKIWQCFCYTKFLNEGTNSVNIEFYDV